MQSVLKKGFFIAALATLAAPAFSQSTTPAPVVEQRKENQQDRIANGVQSGQLTAGGIEHVRTAVLHGHPGGLQACRFVRPEMFFKEGVPAERE